MPVSSIALQIARNSQGWPIHILNPVGLPPDSRRISPATHRDAPDSGDLLRYLGCRQHAAMSGLGALADLEFDHLDLVVGRDAGEFFRVERTIAVAAAEIAGADLPDDVAAVFAMIGTDTALAGIVREAALPGAGIQCPHGLGAERAKTHGRDVEDRRRIRPGAIGAADGDAEFSAAKRLRRHRMMHPFVTLAIDVFLGTERPLVELHLGALIDQRTGVAGERHAVLLALEEVLPHLGANFLEQETNMR